MVMTEQESLKIERREPTYIMRFARWWLGLMAAISILILVVMGIALIADTFSLGIAAFATCAVACAFIAAIAAV